MDQPKVYFHSYAKRMNPVVGLERVLQKSEFASVIPRGAKVAVKLHMGEMGNIRHIRPVFVRKVVDTIKKSGGSPFLFDTVVSYPGERYTREKYLRTAAMNGFAEATMEAPVIVFDDDDKMEKLAITRPVEGCHMTEAIVPAGIMQSDCLVVLSHVKGHELSGFGGAIKNMAMGCMSRQTKRAQHSVNMPVFKEDNTCTACGKCVDKCPSNAIKVLNGKAVHITVECTYCGTCMYVCPEHCWEYPPRAKEKLQVCLGHAAGALLAYYRGKKIFVNFIQDIIPDCDCVGSSALPVVQDVGIAVSLDPVAVDKASLDLIDKMPVIASPHPAEPPDILGKMHQTDSLIHLRTAAKQSAGILDYELVAI